MKQFFSVCALAALVALPDLAGAFTTPRGIRVNQVDAYVFEVIPKTGGKSEDFWCGAAEYARRELGARWQDRVYVARGRGESVTTGRRSAVQFTINPGEAGVPAHDGAWFRTGFKPGDSMSVQQGHNFCNQPPVRF